jgi:hypothetical protein
MSNSYPRDFSFVTEGIIITLNAPASLGNYRVIAKPTAGVPPKVRHVLNFQIEEETSEHEWTKVVNYEGTVMLRVGYIEGEENKPVTLYNNDAENDERSYPNEDTEPILVPGSFYYEYDGHFLIVDQQGNFPDPRIGIG